MTKHLLALLTLGLISTTAVAQPFNARGTFNGWGETPMVDDGDGTYSLTIPGLTPGDRHNYKIAFNDWAASWPGSDARSAVDAAGEMTLHYIPGVIADGWNPAADRVGYDDHGQHAWEIFGSFNNWDDLTLFPERQMTNMGGGLYSVDFTIANPGTHDFKFREPNSWDISIGGDFGNAAGDAQVDTTAPNQVITFELDLPNGRWRAIPEPATLGLLAVGAVVFIRRRR